MHNSQEGAAVNAGGPAGRLLVSGCVGCHSNTVNSQTIVDGVPIVYNTSEPALPLAGGNFYWVGLGAAYDAYGHNVYGISNPDSRLSTAPAINGWAAICIDPTCHKSLALAAGRADFGYKQGCEGCHYKVSHHVDTGWYRFVTGHSGQFLSAPVGLGGYVVGYEDPNWEQNPTAATHNEYKGTTSQYAIPASYPQSNLETYKSMTAYCVGCHGNFHTQTESGGVWLRHPSEVLIPGAGTEFESYTVYNPAVPVARIDAETRGAASGVVVPGTDVVMCLSCHRPHGSPYPHILRWEYTTGVEQGTTGCRTCHTQK
jgi:predicted CXXCH cytochrome family protein